MGYRAILSRTPNRDYKAEYWRGSELIDVHFWKSHCKAIAVLKQSGAILSRRNPETFHLWPAEMNTFVTVEIPFPSRWFWESPT